MTHHKVEIQIDDGAAVFNFSCHAPEGSMCRVHCEQGCEEWSEGHEHPLVASDRCSFVEWADAMGADEIHQGTQTIATGLSVSTEYTEGMGYTWKVVVE